MRLIDADAFKKQIAAAAIQNGSEVAAQRASAMINLVDSQPDAITGCCEGCKWGNDDAENREICIHCSRAYSDEYEPEN